jgi:hypothetical protein
MRSPVLIPMLVVAGACLCPARPAAAGQLSGSVSIGSTTTRSETTITVYPSGETYRSTTRTETRGGGLDLVFGRGRRVEWRGPVRGDYGPYGNDRHPYGGLPRHPYGLGYTAPTPCAPRSPGLSAPAYFGVQPLPAPVVPGLYPGLDVTPR